MYINKLINALIFCSGEMNGHVPFTNTNNGRNFTAAHRARDTSGRERVDTTQSPPKVRFAVDTRAPSGDHSCSAKEKFWLPPNSFCSGSDNKMKSIELHQFADQQTSAEKDVFFAGSIKCVVSRESGDWSREAHGADHVTTSILAWPLRIFILRHHFL